MLETLIEARKFSRSFWSRISRLMCNGEVPLVRREGRVDFGFGTGGGESIGRRLRRRNRLEIKLGIITGYNMLQWLLFRACIKESTLRNFCWSVTLDASHWRHRLRMFKIFRHPGMIRSDAWLSDQIGSLRPLRSSLVPFLSPTSLAYSTTVFISIGAADIKGTSLWWFST